MSELTLHLTSVSEPFTLHVNWTDRNNVRHDTNLAVYVKDKDRETSLIVTINGVTTSIDN